MKNSGLLGTALACSVLLLGGCDQPQAAKTGGSLFDVFKKPPPTGSVDHVASLLVGSFSSQAQAAADPEFRDIRLNAVAIWPARNDGPWIYVEQAAAATLDRPYRQRVYQIAVTPPPADDPEGPAAGIESRVFELPGDPLTFAGAWQDPRQFESLAPADLLPREGCTVFLTAKSDGSYEGGTDGEGCSSSLRGAAYATSVVVLTVNEIRSWDRGFDKEGTQVWGAVKAPYVFVRVRDAKPIARPRPASSPATPSGPERATPM